MILYAHLTFSTNRPVGFLLALRQLKPMLTFKEAQTILQHGVVIHESGVTTLTSSLFAAVEGYNILRERAHNKCIRVGKGPVYIPINLEIRQENTFMPSTTAHRW